MRELNLTHGAKFSRIYAQQVEALDKHRRKGRQTVVVEHVHVNDGGQAVVGSVLAGRGGVVKKWGTTQCASPARLGR